MNRIKKFLFNKGSMHAYAFIAAAFSIIPEDFFRLLRLNENWSDVVNIISVRLLVSVLVVVIANIIYHFYYNNRKEVVLSEANYAIQIEYGNLFKITSGKKVINFDECFTTKVGEAPSDIKPNSVCGQYLSSHPIDNINELIKVAEVKPLREKSKFNGLDRYELGTLIPRGEFLLMAFAKLDENGLGHLTYEEYLRCLNKLWEQIDIYHGTHDVYIPILGSLITRFLDKDLTQQQLLDIMISSYRLSQYKIKRPYKLHIVCTRREGFSLNNIFGID